MTNMFMKKETCVLVRSPSDHGDLYDPLYNPSDWSELFEQETAVCNWLADLFSRFLIQLGYPTRTVSVSCWMDVFVVRLSNHEEFYVPKADIEKGDFHPSCIDEYIPIPIWFSNTRAFLSSTLRETPRDELRMAIDLNTTVFGSDLLYNEDLMPALTCGTRGTKANVTNLILDWAIWYRSLLGRIRYAPLCCLVQWLASRKNVDLDITRCTRTRLISMFYTLAFGSVVASKLRTPPPVLIHDELRNRDALTPMLERLLGQTVEDQLTHLETLSKLELQDSVNGLHPDRRFVVPGGAGTLELARSLQRSLLGRALELSGMSNAELHRILLCYYDPMVERSTSDINVLLEVLAVEYTCAVMNRVTGLKEPGVFTKVNEKIVFRCLRDYKESTNITVPDPCSVCARAIVGMHMTSVNISSASEEGFDLELLRLTDPAVIQHCIVSQVSSEFTFGDERIDGLMIDKAGVVMDGMKRPQALLMCRDCRASLASGVLPIRALANGLYRGKLPDRFADMTWVEEMVCCIYRPTAVVARVFCAEDAKNSTVLHGNTCAHEMNVMSTATVLPRTPPDMNGLLSVVFIGPVLRLDKLKPLFRIRKQKVWDFLLWLKHHNEAYLNMTLDPHRMDLYPDDDILPGLSERVIFNRQDHPDVLFQTETAGMSEHPAEDAVKDPQAEGEIYMDSFGLSDPEGTAIPARSFRAAALRGLNVKPTQELPDLIISRSAKAVSEYQNPKLLPGMFPTLFPFGIGGFEKPDRAVKISMHAQANCFLDLQDKCFRYHRFFIFVIFNIMQRRAGHLHTHLTVKKERFAHVAERLARLSPDTLRAVSSVIETEGKIDKLSDEQRSAFELLSYVNVIAAHQPGSHASKLRCRSTIRDYMGYWGIAHIYLTINPCATHSPIFQIFFGDRAVDLTRRYPTLVPRGQRAVRVATDPVAAADFYEFCVRAIFKDLFGWNFEERRSKDDGGILGKLEAHYGVTEVTECGGLHGHFLLWLANGSNPGEVHRQMEKDSLYGKNFFEFFEDTIHHHLPDIDIQAGPDPDDEPRSERPPDPPPANYQHQFFDLDRWNAEFLTELKRCGEKFQRHECRKVCYKYGSSTCRFLFPHQVIEKSYYDEDTNSIYLLCKDPTVNYHNRWLTVYCRHNHDIKCILSGQAARAAMFYITDYITKFDFKTHQLLSLLSTAAEQTAANKPDGTLAEAKLLLQKCMTQLGRQQQIHAQQAVRYIRGFGDGMASHLSTPVLAALAIYEFKKSNGVANGAVEKEVESDAITEGEEEENMDVYVQTDEEGSIRRSNQVQDYMFRDAKLSHVSFYEFARQYEVVKAKQTTSRSSDTFELQQAHPLSATHRISRRSRCSHERVPRFVGVNIPRSDKGEVYAAFVLALFMPWSASKSVVRPDESYEQCLARQLVSPGHKRLLDNWEAMFECEDEREADRRKKQESMHRASNVVSTLVAGDLDEDMIDVALCDNRINKKDKALTDVIQILNQSNFFNTVPLEPTEVGELPPVNLLQTSCRLRKGWDKQLKRDLETVLRDRANMFDVAEQNIAVSEVISTTVLGNEITAPKSGKVASTINTVESAHGEETLEKADLIKNIADEFQLNSEQRLLKYNLFRRETSGTLAWAPLPIDMFWPISSRGERLQ